MFSERRGRRSLHPNIQQIDKTEFEDVTIPSLLENDVRRTWYGGLRALSVIRSGR